MPKNLEYKAFKCRVEVFNLMKFNLSFFSLLDYAFGVIFKKTWPNPKLQRFSPVISSRCLIILGYRFRAISQILLSFVMVQDQSIVLFHIWIVSCSSTISSEEYHFSIELP